MTTDPLAYHTAALEAVNSGKDMPPISADHPQCGFYYSKASRAGGRIPVCIYADANGDLVARSGTKEAHRMEDATRQWVRVADRPVDRGTYAHAWKTGTWPDGTPTTAVDGPVALGDNAPDDPFQAVKEQADDKIASAQAWLKAHPVVKTQVECDYAANLNKELLALKKTADALHAAEKAPILEAERHVEDKFRFRVNLKGTADALKIVFETFMKAEDRRKREEAERQHRDEVARAEAERKRIADERAKLHRDDPIAALTSPEPEMPTLPLAPVVPKTQAGGGIGSARGLKTVWVPAIRDHAAALAHFATHPDIVAALEKIVKAEARVHKQATKIPGVEMIEDRKVA